MGWFRLLWTILFAVSVSCQNLTTLFPQDDDACMRNEVTFSCTVRGSLSLTDLILAWSSPVYIGQGTPLRFTTQDTPGANKMSMINENVTATLISNTRINGVPELVSELHVVGASQTSVITCSSESNQTSMSTTFVSSAFPGRPQNGEARERSAGSCDFQVIWDRPINVDIFDIGSYIIYVPSRDMMNVSLSTTIGLIIPDCRIGNNSIQVAAVNRFGCVGPNSSHIQLSLLEIPQDPPSGGLPAQVVGGIVGGGVGAFFIIIIAGICAIYYLRIWYIAAKEAKKRRKRTEVKFGSYLALLYETLKRNILSSMKEVVRDLLELEMSSDSIKAALKEVLETRVTSAEDLQNLKTMIPEEVRSNSDAELWEAMDKLIALKDEDNLTQPHNELIRLVGQASPKKINDLLKKLFEALRDCSEAKIQNEVEKALEELGETVAMQKEKGNQNKQRIKEILVDATIKLLDDTGKSASSRNENTGKSASSSRNDDTGKSASSSRNENTGKSASSSRNDDTGKSASSRNDDTGKSASSSIDHQEPSSSPKKSKESKEKGDGGESFKDPSNAPQIIPVPLGPVEQDSKVPVLVEDFDNDPYTSGSDIEPLMAGEDQPPRGKQQVPRAKKSKRKKVSIHMEDFEDPSGPPSGRKQQQVSEI